MFEKWCLQHFEKNRHLAGNHYFKKMKDSGAWASLFRLRQDSFFTSHWRRYVEVPPNAQHLEVRPSEALFWGVSKAYCSRAAGFPDCQRRKHVRGETPQAFGERKNGRRKKMCRAQIGATGSSMTLHHGSILWLSQLHLYFQCSIGDFLRSSVRLL